MRSTLLSLRYFAYAMRCAGTSGADACNNGKKHAIHTARQASTRCFVVQELIRLLLQIAQRLCLSRMALPLKIVTILWLT
eukprot:m.52706 g.52706  ORF g.52706 m.52706 type:complete len:80 (+) comp9122_c0_seq1:170-409(+)